jgi:hypothetical protein
VRQASPPKRPRHAVDGESDRGGINLLGISVESSSGRNLLGAKGAPTSDSRGAHLRWPIPRPSNLASLNILGNVHARNHSTSVSDRRSTPVRYWKRPKADILNLRCAGPNGLCCLCVGGNEPPSIFPDTALAADPFSVTMAAVSFPCFFPFTTFLQLSGMNMGGADDGVRYERSSCEHNCGQS